MSDLLERAASALIAAPPNAGPDPSELRARAAHDQRVRSVVVGVVPVLLIVVGLVAISVVRAGDHASTPMSQPPTSSVGVGDVARVDVDYELIEYREESALTCAKPILDGEPETAVISSIADRQGHRWRTDVAYPDGTSRSLIVTGNAYVPDGSAEAGTPSAHVVGCTFGADDYVIVAEPAQGSFRSLNPMSDMPTTDLSGQPLPPDAVAVPTFKDQGSVNDGDSVDSRGRPAQLWTLVINGSFSSQGFPKSPGVQTQQWWVDAATGQVLEYRFNQTIDGIGSATGIETLIDSGSMVVTDAALDDPTVSALALAPDSTTTGEMFREYLELLELNRLLSSQQDQQDPQQPEVIANTELPANTEVPGSDVTETWVPGNDIPATSP